MKQSLKTINSRVVAFLSSLGLSIVLFGLLMLLTYLGTLYQVEHGLYEAQRKYFDSMFLIHNVGGALPIPLPGGYTVLALLFVNLLFGGVLRMRKGWRQAGMLIAHAGILILLVGGFVTFHYSSSGHVTLYEGERSNVFKSYHEWELAVTKQEADGTRREFVIPADDFNHVGPQESKQFHAAGLPFALTVGHFLRNADPQPANPVGTPTGPIVDGFYLRQLAPERNRERNVPGVHAVITENGGGKEHEVLLWGMQRQPAAVNVNGATWTFDLRRQQWELPFTIVLDEFHRDLHPRTNMPSGFKSDVTKIERGHEENTQISMNKPLRHEGYTLYQASWGPSDAGPGDPLFSSLAVVRDPAEDLPMIATIVVSFGMLLHFSIKLRKYLRREQKKRPV